MSSRTAVIIVVVVHIAFASFPRFVDCASTAAAERPV